MAWSCAVVTAIWLTCLAFFFQALGFAIPFWLAGSLDVPALSTTSEAFTLDYYISVWYSMACVEGSSKSCESKTITPRFDSEVTVPADFGGNTAELIVDSVDLVLGHVVWWSVLQLCATIATGLTALAVLILICCRCAGIHSQGFFILTGFLLICGGLLAMLVAVVMAYLIASVFSFTSVTITGKTFPYSILLFGIGGILGVIAAIYLFVIVCCKWRQYGRYQRDNDFDDDVPMSKISRSRDSKIGYDRPRQRDYDQNGGRDYFYEDRNYRPDRNGYEKKNRDYRDYENRGYDRGHDQSYERQYSDGSPYRYVTDNMYRPYRY